MSDHTPKAGDKLGSKDVEMILEAVAARQKKFDEPPTFSFLLVMIGIGDRFAPVECIEQEWTGLKRDIPPGEGVPKCPNGHVLVQGPGLKLAWVEDD